MVRVGDQIGEASLHETNSLLGLGSIAMASNLRAMARTSGEVYCPTKALWDKTCLALCPEHHSYILAIVFVKQRTTSCQASSTSATFSPSVVRSLASFSWLAGIQTENIDGGGYRCHRNAQVFYVVLAIPNMHHQWAPDHRFRGARKRRGTWSQNGLLSSHSISDLINLYATRNKGHRY